MKKTKKISRSSDRMPSPLARVSNETKKSVIGVLLLGAAIILFLAAFNSAGPVGAFLWNILHDKLLGVGYYLIPSIFLLVGFLFLISKEKKFFGVIFIGMLAFVLSGLGLIDVIFPQTDTSLPATAGWIGQMVGSLEIPFGHSASIILLIVLLIVSLMITLNASINFSNIKLPWRDEEDEVQDEDDEDIEIDEEEIVIADAPKAKPAMMAKREDEDIKIADEPVIKINKTKPTEVKNYVAPPLTLLESTIDKPTPGDLRASANIIKRTLESFGIPVEMGEINIGPKVTRYTLKPAEGVKITRITALGNDLALALAAHPIRIEAPIPGKSLVGIEVPNKQASVVRLGSMLNYPDFTGGGQLVFPLGRDVSGEPIFANIEKLPHLLVAGATGSGKSILIHSIIIPMLFKNSPEMLKMIMIDPKRVELSIYDGIPHLISPVITEGKKSIAVFRWAISEMDRRYEILQRAGARDIKSYNKNNKDDQLPYVMIVIDELADLMATFGREIEGYIVRLAQMARATGIHLVLATQRPSVEVVTGLIKANITGRIGLQMASQIDSRTILDTGGAEKLLGGGDLLFISNEYSKPKRIQGAYITEEEIRAVVKFIVDHNETLGPDEATAESQALANAMKPAAPGEAEAKSGGVFDDYMGSNDDEDEMLEQAIQVVKEAKKASASLLQRRLQVGYARAARLLDIMENKGLIGPGDGAKPREVYMADDEISAGPPETPTASL